MKLKKWHVALMVSAGVLMVTMLFAFVIIVGLWFLFPTPKWKRQKMAEYYRSGIGCTVIKANISENDISYEGANLIISFNEAEIIQKGHDVYWESYNGTGIVSEAGIAELQKNGFFDAVKDSVTLTIRIDFKIWWDGWMEQPIMEIKDDDNVYLDNETAVEEFVDWILYKMY